MYFDKLIDEDIEGLAQIGVTLPINAVVLRDYLPHRYPFMLLDRVTAVKPNEWITGVKNITINEPFFNGHFPEEPIMPGVLMIEAMAQSVRVSSPRIIIFWGIETPIFMVPSIYKNSGCTLLERFCTARSIASLVA